MKICDKVFCLYKTDTLFGCRAALDAGGWVIFAYPIWIALDKALVVPVTRHLTPATVVSSRPATRQLLAFFFLSDCRWFVWFVICWRVNRRWFVLDKHISVKYDVMVLTFSWLVRFGHYRALTTVRFVGATRIVPLIRTVLTPPTKYSWQHWRLGEWPNDTASSTRFLCMQLGMLVLKPTACFAWSWTATVCCVRVLPTSSLVRKDILYECTTSAFCLFVCLFSSVYVVTGDQFAWSVVSRILKPSDAATWNEVTISDSPSWLHKGPTRRKMSSFWLCCNACLRGGSYNVANVRSCRSVPHNTVSWSQSACSSNVCAWVSTL